MKEATLGIVKHKDAESLLRGLYRAEQISRVGFSRRLNLLTHGAPAIALSGLGHLYRVDNDCYRTICK